MVQQEVEEELTSLYLDLGLALSNAEDLFSQREYESVVRQANMIIEGISRIEGLLRNHPYRPLLEMQIGAELKEYKESAHIIKERGRVRSTSSSPPRINGEPESPESKEFWLDIYETQDFMRAT
ncbi:MAG: hypothetical protein AABX59_03135 [Nanoarchaeota archaeon]